MTHVIIMSVLLGFVGGVAGTIFITWAYIHFYEEGE